ncbi:alpha/beta hydrolase [Halococcus hamelinensis]|uniref:alpha/beta hydrolase n=1 Tax=Halococcus hamelinensis TaxID=332168 RepID=UPI000B0A4074|nr:alpha/beta hydrolase [Halococcus hamelinensis]
MGETHLLLAGDPDAKPLLVPQGGNVTTPVTLAWVEALANEYRLLAPDTPGQPRKTTARAADYGRWLVALLDALGVEAVPAVGISHGAGVLLEAPDRFESVSLVVPAGFGVEPPAGLARVGVPSLAYRFLPRCWLLDRALGSLATELPASLPPVVRDTIAADDPFFPARTIGPRIRTTFPECREGLTLPDERHLLGPTGRSRTRRTRRAFLGSESPA